MPSGIYTRTEKHLKESISHLPKNPQFWKGKTFSKEHKKNLSKNHKGMKGKKHSEETKIKFRKPKSKKTSYRGVRHHAWKGGITPHSQKIRNSQAYKNWRRKVFERDNYACQWCGARSGKGKRVVLNADHIKLFATHPHLRLKVNNGRTLCVPCHKTRKRI